MVGRIQEISILEKAFKSTESELVAIYGRRRVGKTYLVREHFAGRTFFSFSGLFMATQEEQLKEFSMAMSRINDSSISLRVPKDWFEAFNDLRIIIEADKSKKKKVIFLDEVPWIATAKSRFLTAFENFWNGWASGTKNLLIIICGSASSWMINKIEKSKGGLYNRVTRRIVLQPFTLGETEAFLKSKNINLSRYHLVEMYMILGGIPHYLNQIEKGDTPAIAANRVIFSNLGLLKDEFEQLFESLFGENTIHKKIVELLAQHRYGLVREEILKELNLSSSGWLSGALEELETSGFLKQYVPFGNKKKDARFKLVDNYCLFYVKFKMQKEISNWETAYNSASWNSWRGLTFENVVLSHSKNIIKSLSISGINTNVSTWHQKGNAEVPGAQIDMLIERGDKAFNICEIKFSENPFLITKQYAYELSLKKAAFSYYLKSKRTLLLTFISFAGVIDNEYARQAIDNQISIDDLFD